MELLIFTLGVLTGIIFTVLCAIRYANKKGEIILKRNEEENYDERK